LLRAADPLRISNHSPDTDAEIVFVVIKPAA